MKEGKHRMDVWQWCQEGSQTGRHPLPPSPGSPGSSSTLSTPPVTQLPPLGNKRTEQTLSWVLKTRASNVSPEKWTHVYSPWAQAGVCREAALA